ncbi:MAG: NUDIX domain-containing protein [Blastocatellia bacterium]|nr:NUDIX domain-containing protein [Blastocatellia bacterium]
MRQLLQEKKLCFAASSGLVFTEKTQQLRRLRKPQSILLRVSVWEALRLGAKFWITKRGYRADTLFLETVSCRKLPGRYENLQKVDAAGGVVFRDEKEEAILLLLKREGRKLKWVLPKGRRKPDETRRRTAIREVREETGIDLLKVVRFIGREGYFVVENKKIVYKRVSYYAMQFEGEQQVNVNRAEGFIEGKWVTIGDALRLTKPARTHHILRLLLDTKPVVTC